MAKPYEQEPGSAMHIHQSVVDTRDAARACSRPRTARTRACSSPISPACSDICRRPCRCIAPFVNSYRRLVRFLSRADQHALGPRQPHGGLARAGVRCAEPARRKPCAGADANPYLAIAASLACGYIGMIENLVPTKAMEGNAYESTRYQLPRHILDSRREIPCVGRPERRAGREIRAALQRCEKLRARCISAGDQPVGASAFVAECVMFLLRLRA